MVKVIRDHRAADLVHLTGALPDELRAQIYAAADAVLANSGHEPFGLVGLEAMAAGGLAVTGSTGEDYAEPMRNALVAETDDPLELVTLLRLVKDRPALASSIRKRGRATARDYAWDKVIEQLILRIEIAATKQAGQPPLAVQPNTRATRTQKRPPKRPTK
jgi:glycosyltransferase involved in cell wall biosynthesis